MPWPLSCVYLRNKTTVCVSSSGVNMLVYEPFEHYTDFRFTFITIRLLLFYKVLKYDNCISLKWVQQWSQINVLSSL